MDRTSRIRWLLFIIAVSLAACQAQPAAPPSPTAVPATITLAPAATPTASQTLPGHYSYTTTSFFDLLPDGTFFGPQWAGDYTVQGDKVTFVNQGVSACGDKPGVYQWSFEGTKLILTPIDDACLLRLNAFKALPLTKVDISDPYVDFVWETSVTDPDFDPNGMALDSAGNIYLSNGHLPRVEKYDSKGNFLSSWPFNTVKDPGTYGTGIAVGDQGKIYAANFLDARIEMFDPGGTFLSGWQTQDGQPGPVGMGTDAQGNLYVALHRIHDHYVEKYDREGNLLATWGSQGNGEGQVGAGPHNGPEQIDVDAAGNNYISDAVNDRVVVFDKDGNFKFNITGDGNPDFRVPRDIAVDSHGHIFVVGDNPYLWEYDSNGSYVGRWLAPGIGPISAASDGNLITSVPWGLAEIQLPQP